MQDNNQIQRELISVSEKYGGLESEDLPEKRRHNDVGEFIPIISVQKYREILGDKKSVDEQITRRLEYIEALCRNVMRQEIENYVEESKRKK